MLFRKWSAMSVYWLALLFVVADSALGQMPTHSPPDPPEERMLRGLTLTTGKATWLYGDATSERYFFQLEEMPEGIVWFVVSTESSGGTAATGLVSSAAIAGQTLNIYHDNDNVKYVVVRAPQSRTECCGSGKSGPRVATKDEISKLMPAFVDPAEGKPAERSCRNGTCECRTIFGSRVRHGCCGNTWYPLKHPNGAYVLCSDAAVYWTCAGQTFTMACD